MALRGSSSTNRISRGRLCAESSAADVGDEIRFGDVVGHHERPDQLTEVGVGYADHGGLAYRGVSQQRVFDLTSTDAIPTGLDEVDRSAPDDPMPASRGRSKRCPRCGTSRPRSTRRRSPPAGSGTWSRASARVLEARRSSRRRASTRLPSSATSRVVTPRTGNPTYPASPIAVRAGA